MNSTALAIFHTAFNVVVTIVLFPFANWLVKLSKVLIPGHKTDSEQDAQLVLDPRLLTMPTAALNAVRSDLDRVSTGCSALIDETRDCLINNKKKMKFFLRVRNFTVPVWLFENIWQKLIDP